MAIVTLTDANFAELVERPGVALVDFWAEWCFPCHMVAPTIERIAETYIGRVTVGKLNVDENRRTMMRFAVSGIPTIGVFKDGKLVDMVVGARPYQAYADALDHALTPEPAR